MLDCACNNVYFSTHMDSDNLSSKVSCFCWSCIKIMGGPIIWCFGVIDPNENKIVSIQGVAHKISKQEP